MREILEQKWLISARDTDMHGLLRPSSLLSFLQDTATVHAEDLGVDRDVLSRGYGAFWMLVRLWARLDRPLRYEEELTVRTWHRGAGGAQVLRDFDLLVGGEPVGEAITSWVVAGIADRKLIRPSAIEELVQSARPPATKTGRPEKLGPGQNMARWGHRRVRYSDADLNGHMNNVRYADVACDAVGYGEMRGRFVSAISINFLHECFPGEDILVLTGYDGARYMVRGTDDQDLARFDVALTISEMEKAGGEELS